MSTPNYKSMKGIFSFWDLLQDLSMKLVRLKIFDDTLILLLLVQVRGFLYLATTLNQNFTKSAIVIRNSSPIL